MLNYAVCHKTVLTVALGLVLSCLDSTEGYPSCFVSHGHKIINRDVGFLLITVPHGSAFFVTAYANEARWSARMDLENKRLGVPIISGEDGPRIKDFIRLNEVLTRISQLLFKSYINRKMKVNPWLLRVE